MTSLLLAWMKKESASGIVLMVSALLAMLAANSALFPFYKALQDSLLGFVINDGLMALFFLVVGFEIRHEIADGALSSLRQALLPLSAALGGMIVPALIFLCFNAQAEGARGWAIPSATDIAFSLGVLALFGDRVAPALRLFLMSVAVIDDLGAVLIIALFYTDHVDMLALACVAFFAWLLWALGRFHVSAVWLYMLVGLALWTAMCLSGVHATIAGVIMGFCVPLSVGKQLVRRLQPCVAFAIVPLFAFVNAGVSLRGMTPATIAHPVTVGIALGLFAGKQLGIFLGAWLPMRLRLAAWPAGVDRLAFYAVCVLTGIGFTMSLFIGSLAFGEGDLQSATRLGVISGSLVSAVLGYIMMRIALYRKLRS